jgi:hypothetical protein
MQRLNHITQLIARKHASAAKGHQRIGDERWFTASGHMPAEFRPASQAGEMISVKHSAARHGVTRLTRGRLM